MKKEKKLIELKQVCKVYDMGNDNIVEALKKFSLDIYEGEFLAILGPSGSGKSTLLHMMGLLDVPSCGEIFVENVFINEMSEDETAYFRGIKVGFVFQVFNLIPSLNALENVTLPMMIYDVGKEKREKRAFKLLNDMGLKGRELHKPMELSGGQRQRVAVARALANDPPIIFADEPTGNLDTRTGDEIITLFKQLNEKGKTIVMVTHNEELTRYCDRIVYIKDGRIDSIRENNKIR
jgi:putative ABC transport system ATP-binding protein